MKLVNALNKEELRSLKLLFKQYKLSNGNSSIGKLLDVYRKHKNIDDKVIHLKAFSSLNKNAFYITLAEVFSYKSEYELAYKILEKAEKKASENKYYNLLIIIYNEIINISWKFNKIPLDSYLKKKKEVSETIKQHEQMEYLSIEIAWNLQKSNLQEKSSNVLEELEFIKGRVENSDLLSKTPTLQISLQRIIRNVLLQKGDFESLSIYTQTTLQEFEENKIFSKTNYSQKIIMQVWLINSLLKLKDFKNADIEAENLMNSLLNFNKLYYKNFIWTYYQSKFISTYYLGDLENALSLLLSIKAQYNMVEIDNYILFINQNLFTIYYSLNKYKQSNKYLNELLNQEFFDVLSNDLKINIIIIDLIMYYENKDYNYLIYKIKEIKRRYRVSLSKPNFERAKLFINILDIISKSPNPFENERVLPKLYKFINDSPPFEPGNNENINYKVWLLSKLNKRNYFDELLLEIKPD